MEGLWKEENGEMEKSDREKREKTWKKIVGEKKTVQGEIDTRRKEKKNVE